MSDYDHLPARIKADVTAGAARELAAPHRQSETLWDYLQQTLHKFETPGYLDIHDDNGLCVCGGTPFDSIHDETALDPRKYVLDRLVITARVKDVHG